MKPDDRFRDFWQTTEERPATRKADAFPHITRQERDLQLKQESRDWERSARSLAERLETFNEYKAREAMRKRVRLIGWIFIVLFVLAFIAIAWLLS